MKYQADHNRIIVKITKKDLQKQGLLFIPVNSEDPLIDAEVVGVGPGFYSNLGKLIALTTKVGDQVIIPKQVGYILPRAGNPELKEDQELRVCQDSDVLVHIKQEEIKSI
jgi:co-chaperonin GroES (HSP10)